MLNCAEKGKFSTLYADTYDVQAVVNFYWEGSLKNKIEF